MILILLVLIVLILLKLKKLNVTLLNMTCCQKIWFEPTTHVSTPNTKLLAEGTIFFFMC